MYIVSQGRVVSSKIVIRAVDTISLYSRSLLIYNYFSKDTHQMSLYCDLRMFLGLFNAFHTGPRITVGNVSDCRSRGREFDPGSVPYFSGDRS